MTLSYKGTGAKRLKSNLKYGPTEDPSANHILATHASVFMGGRISSLSTTPRRRAG